MNVVEHFGGKESNLTFVIFAVIVEPIAANSVAGDTFDSLKFNERKIIGWLPMMAKIVVAGRNKNLLDDH